jgi:hypothetical protein
MALGRRVNLKIARKRMPLLKKLFWLYFLLLIFEGALRKWILPQLSGPLLIIRDPVGLLIIAEALRTRKWPRQWSSVIGIFTVAILGLSLLQLVVSSTPWFVELYGLRSYLLPFPIAFIMGENLDAEDLRKFGNCTLWLLLPLTGLEVAQYLAGPASFLNAGAFAGAKQIFYSGDHVRASATFSFVTGPAEFCPLAAAFLFYGLMNERFAKKWLLWAGTGAVILGIPIIGSRTMVVLLGAILLCLVISALLGVSMMMKTLRIVLPLLVLSVLVSFLPIFSEASSSLNERFTTATATEGGNQEQVLWFRVFYPIMSALEQSTSAKRWLGLGMGYGSNAASTMMTGTQVFTVGEGDFARILNEFGPFCGVAFLLFRSCLALWLVFKALARARDNDVLAMLLIPLTFIGLILGDLEQPTSQGFMVIGLAFSLAAVRRKEISRQSAPVLNARWRQAQYKLPARASKLRV